MKILISRAWPEPVEERLSNLSVGEVTLRHPDTMMDHSDWLRAAQAYDVIMPTVSDSIPEEFYGAAKGKVKLMANYGVGYNHIDVAAAEQNDIVVTNTPGVLTDCTADLAMGLLLAAARRIGEGEREVRCGGWVGWRPTHMIGKKVAGATLGIIGFGRIGQAMAQRAHFGFGMDIVFYNRSPISEEVKARYGNARQVPTLTDVAAASDFMSLHCAATPETMKSINADIFGALKPGCILINTARGDVVDEDALFAALDAGHLAGAGLDVFVGEPNLDARFAQYETLVLAPHLGSATDGTRAAMGHLAIDNLEAFAKGKAPPNRVTPA